MKIILGRTYEDIITKFKGVAVGRTEYISGCTQVLLQPPAKKDGKRPDGEWFDEQRLRDCGKSTITLDNRTTPGCDKPAPVR